MAEFVRAEWECLESRLPYYQAELGPADADPPPVDQLVAGIYLVCDPFGRALDRRGYAALPDRVTLVYDRLKAGPMGFWIDTLGGHLSSHYPAPIVPALARDLAERISFYPNRLYGTLPHVEADALMRRWVANCFTGRCARLGVYAFQDAVGFIGIRKLDAETETIDLVGVREEQRGRGIGSALVRWALSGSQAEQIEVRTEAWNRAALSMYRNLGFKERSRSRLWWCRVE